LDLQPGSSFGPYRIVAPLGRGGMATVYRAHDPALDRDVALKVLPAEFLHDPAFAERFRQEARVAARLEHPHVVPIHNFGIEGGRPWMAMRLVTGGSLAGRVARGPLVPREAAALLADVAGALDYAHGRGVVHRDVKPANVLLDEAGRAYLADFGVAKMLEGSSIATATGLIQGTPSYMAPEQAMGAKVDHLADVYALGVMAFECLTGRVPYTGTTPVAILMKHVQEPVPEPTAAEVAPQLAAVLRRCLAKTPSERWPTAGAFTAALGQAAAGVTPAEPVALPTLTVPPTPVPGATRRPTPARPAAPPPGRSTWRWAAAGGVAALAVLAVAGGLLVRGLLRTPAAPAASPGPVVTAESPSPSPTAVRPERAAPATPPPVAVPTPRPARPSAAPTPVPATPEPTPTPVATPVPTPTPVPPEPAALPAGLPPEGVAPPVAPPRSGRIRVYCEAKLEPVLFRKADEKDVADSLKDLKEAIEERGVLEVVPRHEADAVVQVLERGREPAVIGMRKVRVRVVLGGQSVELTGRDSLKGFNTWGGAAKGAAKQVESWLKGRLEPSE
jgi:serine/threonine-protein kinase